MEAVRRSRAKPVVRLARAAESYIAFAESSPALFRLMFSKELVDLSRHPAAQAAGFCILRIFGRDCQCAHLTGDCGGPEPRRLVARARPRYSMHRNRS
jgi:hypothetical protein